MSDEPDVPEDGDEYIPEPTLIHEDSFLIFDPVEFCDHFNCWGAQMKDGGLFVLCRDTYQWRNVTDFGKNTPTERRLRGVQ